MSTRLLVIGEALVDIVAAPSGERTEHVGGSPANVRVTHRSLFDGSNQGIALTDAPAFSFQGHPEASPGPHDVAPLFDRFIENAPDAHVTFVRASPRGRDDHLHGGTASVGQVEDRGDVVERLLRRPVDVLAVVRVRRGDDDHRDRRPAVAQLDEDVEAVGIAEAEEPHSTFLENALAQQGLIRPRDRRVLGGVCAGLAEHLGVRVQHVRLAFIVTSLAGGAGIAAYIFLWALTPQVRDAPDAPAAPTSA